jgi:hypothetical protein
MCWKYFEAGQFLFEIACGLNENWMICSNYVQNRLHEGGIGWLELGYDPCLSIYDPVYENTILSMDL